MSASESGEGRATGIERSVGSWEFLHDLWLVAEYTPVAYNAPDVLAAPLSEADPSESDRRYANIAVSSRIRVCLFHTD